MTSLEVPGHVLHVLYRVQAVAPPTQAGTYRERYIPRKVKYLGR